MFDANIEAVSYKKFILKPFYTNSPINAFQSPVTFITNYPGNGGTHLLTSLYKYAQLENKYKSGCFSYNRISRCRNKVFPCDFTYISKVFIDNFFIDDFSCTFLKKYFFDYKDYDPSEKKIVIQISTTHPYNPLQDLLKEFNVNFSVLQLKYPDTVIRKKIINSNFVENKIALQERTLDYLSSLNFGSVRELENFMTCIITQAQLNKINLSKMRFGHFIELYTDMLINYYCPITTYPK